MRHAVMRIMLLFIVIDTRIINNIIIYKFKKYKLNGQNIVTILHMGHKS